MPSPSLDDRHLRRKAAAAKAPAGPAEAGPYLGEAFIRHVKLTDNHIPSHVMNPTLRPGSLWISLLQCICLLFELDNQITAPH